MSKEHSNRTVILIQNGMTYASTDSESVMRAWRKKIPAFVGDVQIIQEPEENRNMVIAVPREWGMKSAAFLIPRPLSEFSDTETERLLTDINSVQIPEI